VRKDGEVSQLLLRSHHDGRRRPEGRAVMVRRDASHGAYIEKKQSGKATSKNQ
jgi:hypothetical protein